MKTSVGKKNIMIIDDSRTSLQLIESLVREVLPGATMHSYANSKNACKNLVNITVDLYIIDIHMPHLNGFDIISRIRSTTAPIYIVSSSSDLPILEKAFSLGASEFFVKPFNVERFKLKIKQALILN